MALIEEKAETEMDEITLEPSQAEKTLEGQLKDVATHVDVLAILSSTL